MNYKKPVKYEAFNSPTMNVLCNLVGIILVLTRCQTMIMFLIRKKILDSSEERADLGKGDRNLKIVFFKFEQRKSMTVYRHTKEKNE